MSNILQKFQETLEKSDDFFNQPSEETEPFKQKYEARALLEAFLKDNDLQESQQDIIIKAIICSQLGRNFMICEENSSSQLNYEKALNLFNSLENQKPYTEYIIETLNNLGYLVVNYDRALEGRAHLLRAKHLYEQTLEEEKLNITRDSKKETFKSYYDGGIEKEKIEEYHTLTLFYLAQTYTKLDEKDNASLYCGLTLKRQLESNSYELKDFVVNCISLNEYYTNTKNYSQAYYLLQCALSIIPEDKKKKLRATVQMSLGRMFSDMLQYNVTLMLENQDDVEFVNEKKLLFNCKTEWVDFKRGRKEEDIKQMFRFSNTQVLFQSQYKKCLQIFILDGFVTENVQVNVDIGLLYQNLCAIEKDNKNKIALLERRRDLLQPLLDVLSANAYKDLNEKLLVQLSEVNSALFELNFTVYFVDNAKIKNNRIQDLNKHSQQARLQYNKILEILKNDKANQTKDTIVDYHNSIINAKFNIAKILSRHFSVEKKEKVEKMLESQKVYKEITQYIENEVTDKTEFNEQYKLCKEMDLMMLHKIKKIAEA